MPQDRGLRRKHSRSSSPAASKQKRTWQKKEMDRSPSPIRNKGKILPSFKSPSSFGGPQRVRLNSPNNRVPLSRQRSLSPLPPPQRKRPVSRSPVQGHRGPSSPGPRPVMRDGPPPRRDNHSTKPSASSSRFPSGHRQSSISPKVQTKKPGNNDNRSKPSNTYSRRSPSPERNNHSNKKKPRMRSMSPPPFTSTPAIAEPYRHSRNDNHRTSSSKTPLTSKHRSSSGPNLLRPSSPSHSTPRSGGSGSAKKGDASLPQRRVSSSGKKKQSRLTLHKRFTLEDQEPFQLEDNVTIAILRNPNAEPSEEVTVKRVFDSSVFKMIHNKTAGRRPIFDREEIKIWRHDENLADDPDFERRLVRVKSSDKGGGKKSSDSLSRMSPDVIRKAFGLQVSGVSKSRSPQREQKIRLDPRPDPRYESKYRKQIEKEDGGRNAKNKSHEGGGGDKDKRKVDDGHRSQGDDKKDLRHALERRRSNKDDNNSFRVEVTREGRSGDQRHKQDSRGRANSPEFGNRRQIIDGGGDGGSRNVVFGSGREGGGLRRYNNSVSPDRGFEVDRGGRGFRGRGGFRGRRDWSPGARGGNVDSRSRDRAGSFDRSRYSNSPPNNRGWRGNRGGGARGRGRGRDFSPFRMDIVSPTEIDDSFKYTQHDDRDLSPKSFHHRGRGRGRFPARSFGSNSFRGARGAYRGRGGVRGKGFSAGRDGRDARSPDRRDRSTDREWKHDMYDSLQTEEEPSLSTTMGS